MTFNKLKPYTPIELSSSGGITPIDRTRTINIKHNDSNSIILAIDGDSNDCVLNIRTTGDLAYHAIKLHTDYDWEIGYDSEGCLCAVPLKK